MLMILMSLALLFAFVVATKVVPMLPRATRGAAAFAVVTLVSLASSMASGPDVTDIISTASDTYDAVIPIAIAVVSFGIVISFVKLLKKR